MNESSPTSEAYQHFESLSSSSSDAESESYFRSNDLDFSLTSVEDLEVGIDACKNQILETSENSESRKRMVSKLINLRIRLQDIKDKQERAVSAFESRGHVLICYHEPCRQKIEGVDDARRIYCQLCQCGIWVHLQSSLHCIECGYSIHSSCLTKDNIKRDCVAQKVKTQPDFITDICPEISLAVLKYCCAECDQKLSASRDPRLCDYTGLYFCSGCHWNALFVTPARIIHNWDFEPRLVSQATHQYLRLMYKKPVINISAVNPKLFAVVPELDQVNHLRRHIISMKKYLSVCRVASSQKLLLRLSKRQHFVDNFEMYSLEDLVDVKSGLLLSYLSSITSDYSSHIKSCVLCLAKGFFCEICSQASSNQDDVLFPFDERTSVCQGCGAVYHENCFKDVIDCPRCDRIRSKKEKRKENAFANESL